MDNIKTVTHVSNPSDKRCKWWSALIPDDLTEESLTGRVNFEYFKRGQDLELTKGSMIINSEELHHSKKRGFLVHLGLVGEDRIYWISPCIRKKVFIKEQGYQNLMKGSGDIAGAIRIALYLRCQPDIFKAYEELLYCKKTVVNTEDLS